MTKFLIINNGISIFRRKKYKKLEHVAC